MRILFVSFDEIGLRCLEQIIELKADIVGIFTFPDEYGKVLSGNVSFDFIAKKHNIPIIKNKNINHSETLNLISSLKPDISFVIGWPQLVKSEFICLAPKGCIGMHPTLLPKHRGRAPIPWAFIMGLKKTGVTMFYIDEGTDTGDIIAQEEIEILFHDDAKSLYDKILSIHVQMVQKYYPLLVKDIAPRKKQDNTRASYWHKRQPLDGIIDWDCGSNQLYDWIRGLTDPYPGAFSFCKNKKIYIWKSELLDTIMIRNKQPGEIMDIDESGITVNTGQGRIKIKVVQIEDQSRLKEDEILDSDFFTIGDIFV